MTLNNLQLQISWLLQNKPIPRATTAGPASSTSVAAVESLYVALPGARLDCEDSEQLGILSVPAQPVNAIQEFVRPVNPLDSHRRAGRADNIADFPDENSMARLASASKSTRPTLVSQRQLATPAPTTPSSRSLTASYTASLQESW